VDQKIEGNWLGEGNWYRGRITRVHKSGSVDIAYEDGSGDKEKGVPLRDRHGIRVRLPLEEPVDAEARAPTAAPPPSLPPASAQPVAKPTAKPAAKPASGGGSASWSKGSILQYPVESTGTYRLGEVVTVNKTPGHLGVKPFNTRLGAVEFKTSLARQWNVDDELIVTDCAPLTKCLMSMPDEHAVPEAEMFEYFENVKRLMATSNCASIPAFVKMVESEYDTLFA